MTVPIQAVPTSTGHMRDRCPDENNCRDASCVSGLGQASFQGPFQVNLQDSLGKILLEELPFGKFQTNCNGRKGMVVPLTDASGPFDSVA